MYEVKMLNSVTASNSFDFPAAEADVSVDIGKPRRKMLRTITLPNREFWWRQLDPAKSILSPHYCVFRKNTAALADVKKVEDQVAEVYWMDFVTELMCCDLSDYFGKDVFAVSSAALQSRYVSRRHDAGASNNIKGVASEEAQRQHFHDHDLLGVDMGEFLDGAGSTHVSDEASDRTHANPRAAAALAGIEPNELDLDDGVAIAVTASFADVASQSRNRTIAASQRLATWLGRMRAAKKTAMDRGEHVF
ncbi:MAG: hypothetical protein CL798_00575 [Chromatiales bacterium]|nr:hypothetical protein [Chromatiales bacterium]